MPPLSPSHRGARRAAWTTARAGLLGLLLPTVAAAWSFQAAAATAASELDPTAVASSSLRLAEEKWGVKILSLRTSAEGHIIDVRYRVLDSAKAAPLFARGLKPSLKDEATGQLLSVPSAPKTGSLRSMGRPAEGKTYFVLFGNTGGVIQAGSRVTLSIGELEARSLYVE